MTTSKTTNFDRIVNTFVETFGGKDLDWISSINSEVYASGLNYDIIVEKINNASEGDIDNIIEEIKNSSWAYINPISINMIIRDFLSIKKETR